MAQQLIDSLTSEFEPEKYHDEYRERVLELIGDERCIPPNDADALAARLRGLWADPERRRTEGEELIARARERYGEERYIRELIRLYERLR